MEKWLKWAIEIQSLAQNGLAYTNSIYDKERYERLREISGEIISNKTDISKEKINDLFCNEVGYQTPKIDTRGVIFKDNKILLVQEKDGRWAIPGGWCDVLETIKSNTIKEVKEETGLNVNTLKIIAIHDRSKHNKQIDAYRIMKIFVLCEVINGEFQENSETIKTDYFSLNEIPNNLALEKTSFNQIEMCFKAYNDDNWQVEFD